MVTTGTVKTASVTGDTGPSRGKLTKKWVVLPDRYIPTISIWCQYQFKVPERAEAYTGSTTLQTTQTYTAGDTVTVYYNPENPATQSSLEADDKRVLGGVLLAVGIVSVLAFWSWFAYDRLKRSRRSDTASAPPPTR